MPAPHLTTDIESKRLTALLKELQNLFICPAITDPSLQDQAGPPDGKIGFYQHIQYTEINGRMHHRSSVRSSECLMVPDTSPCKACEHIKKTLVKKKQQEKQADAPINVHNPLHSLEKGKLREACNQMRQEKTDIEKELKWFKEKM